MGYWESETLPKIIRNVFWAVVGTVGVVFASAALCVLFLAIAFGGAALGLWHIHIEDH